MRSWPGRPRRRRDRGAGRTAERPPALTRGGPGPRAPAGGGPAPPRRPDDGTRALLGGLFAALLPTADETWLVRACLATGETGRRALPVGQERLGDLVRSFREDPRGLKRWAPLLEDALRRRGTAAPPALVTILRTAAFREELRGQAYRRVSGQVLALLAGAGVPFLVLDGLALERDYPRPALRHSHDLEILLPQPGDLRRIPPMLGELGAQRVPPPEPASDSAILLQHPSGLPIVLGTRLFRTPHHHVRTESLWNRRSAVVLAGVPAHVLAPDDALLHVLGHAATSPSRTSLQWVADAWFLLDRHPDLDWRRLLVTAREGQLRLVLAAMLPYLRRDLGAPVPADALERVAEAAAVAPRVERDGLLAAVRGSGDGGLRRVVRGLAPRARLRLLLWLLAPSPAYLRRVYEPPSAAILPFLYGYRPLAYAARALSGRLGALPG